MRIPVITAAVLSLLLASCAKKSSEGGTSEGAAQPAPPPGVVSVGQPGASTSGGTGGVAALPPVVAPPGTITPPAGATGDTTAPLVVLGDDLAVRLPHTFAPTVSDAEGVTTYAWWQVDGPGTLTFASPDAKDTLVTASADGVYTIRLVATDAAGNAGQDEVKLTWDTVAPTIDAGADRTVMSSFSQDATPGEAGLSFRWSKVSGPGNVFFGAVTSEDTAININADGFYTVRVTATDAAGNQGADEFEIYWDTTAPTVNVGPDLIVNGSSVDATATDVTALTYAWSKVSGPGNVVFGAPTAEDTTITVDADGIYVIRLSVIDALGNGAVDELTLSADSTPPTVALTTSAPDPFASASFSATITFSESVVGLALSDFVVVNGSVANLAGSGSIYTVDVIAAGQGAVTLNLPAGAAMDAAGNPSTAATQLGRTRDSIAPGTTLASTSPNPTRISPIPVTVTFTEPVTGFALADIAVTNGTAGNLSGTGASYSFEVTPTGQGAVTVDIAAGAADDDAGNDSTAPAQLVRTFDSLAPGVTLASTASNPTSTSPIPVTATFTESVAGFTLADVSVANGTAGNFSGSGATYAFEVTPTADGLVTIDVAAGAASDTAGNTSTAATQLARTFDGTGPSVTLATTAPNPTNTSPIPVTITFSETPTGLALGDFVVGNGSVANLAGSGTSYTVNVIPAGQGTVTIDLPAASVTDALGNAGTASNQITRTYDSVAPGVTLASTASNPTSTSPIPITVTFSESVTGFTLADVIVTNGTVGNFSGSGASYSFEVAPTADGSVTVDIAASAASDTAGNTSTAATQLARTFDGAGPSVTLATTAPNPTNTSPIPVTITFSETPTGLALADFVVGNGSVANLAGSGTSYTVNVIPAGQGTVTIDLPAASVTDALGNAGTASNQITRAFDSTAPGVTLASTALNPTSATPIPVTVTFTETVTGFSIGDVSVTNGTAGNFSGSDASYSFEITPAGQGSVTVNVAAGAATDAAGNTSTAATQLARTFDSAAPGVSMTSSAPNPTNTSPVPVTVTFTEVVTGFALGDISVTNGTAGNLSGSGASYTFDITPAGQGSVSADIAAGAASDASGNTSTAAIQLTRTYDSIAPTASQTGAPTGNSNVTALAVTVAGTDVTHYRHKVGAAASTTCSDSSGYGTSTAVGTPISTSISGVAEGLVRLCIIGRDAAGNWQAFASATSATWTKKTLLPTFTSMALANQAADGYINAADRLLANAIAGSAVGSNFTTAEYALAGALATCSGISTYGAMPLNTSSAFGADGSYKVCARLSDDAGNAPAYGASSPFELALTGPTLALTSSATNPTNANPIAVTATFSTAVTGFTSSDVSVTGGSVAGVTGSGTTYTINVTPSGQGVVAVNVAANVASDPAGNGNQAAASSLSRTYDSVAPTVNGGVTSNNNDGTYPSGQSIAITVTFSEAVAVTGTPTLTLNTTPSRSAVYTSGSTTNVLTFTYTTQAGDAAADLDYATTGSLSGTIRDAAGNNATLTLPTPGGTGSLGANKAIVVDTIAASITSVDSTSTNRAYGAGSVITIRVNYSEAVSVTGTPTIALGTSPARSAAYSSGDGSQELLFTYTVQPGDISGDLEYASQNALSLSGGSITDGSGNSSIVLPAPGGGNSLGDRAEIVIDTAAPTVIGVDSASLDGAYSIGNAIEVAVSFSEAVVVTGSPRVALNVTPTQRYALYTSGSGTGQLVFTYTVASGDLAPDLDYATVNGLELNGGTIIDAADNAAVRTLVAPGADGSLGFARNLIVDHTLPAALAVSGVPSTTHASATRLTVTFPANTAVYDEVQILRVDGATAPADCQSGSLVESLNSFAVNPTLVTDSTGAAGKTYSYRVCAFDAQGAVLATATETSVSSSMFHWMFTTSTTLASGDLGGLAGADAICQTAGETKDPTLTWIAVLSTNDIEARGRLPIAGPIYNLNPTRQTVASSHTDLWDGTIAASVQFTETGSSITTGNRFTGTASGGTRVATNCNNWTSNSSAVTGGRSSVTTTTSTWITNGTGACNSTGYRLLCASRTIAPLTGFTATRPASGADGDVTVFVDMPADTSNWSKVEVRRSLTSTTAPSCGSSTLVKTYNGPTFTDDTFTDATGTPHRFYSYIVCVYNGAAVAAAYTSTMPVRTFNNTAAHLAYYTSTTYTGSAVGGLAGADAKCQQRGDTFITGKTWRAILSTSTVNANSRISSSAQVRTLNGGLVATGMTDLFDGTIASVLNVRETFSTASTSNIWTGSTSTGAASTSHCTNWTSTSGNGTRGNSNSLTSTWISNSTTPCTNARALFCVTATAD